MNKMSPANFTLNCPHFAACSGCSLAESMHRPPVLREMEKWFQDRGIPGFVVHAQKCHAWRMRAKLAVRGTSQNPLIGLYRAGSHEVVDIPSCRVHHPLINAGVAAVKGWITQNELSLYDEKSESGDLRYLQFVVERSSGRLHVSFVVNFTSANQARAALWKDKIKALWAHRQQDLSWHSLAVNFNVRTDNVIFGEDWQLWEGEEFIWEVLAGTGACFKPSSFAQAHLDQFEKALHTIGSWVAPGSAVAEFYAGVGVIGLTLAERTARVRCCEINPHAEECFLQSQKKLSSEAATKISWHQGPSVAHSAWLQEADYIVVDPPRKGLESAFLCELAKVPRGRQLIYLSCGWKSFQKDAKILCEAGWAIEKAEGHLFFPGSDHVETLTLFQKR